MMPEMKLISASQMRQMRRSCRASFLAAAHRSERKLRSRSLAALSRVHAQSTKAEEKLCAHAELFGPIGSERLVGH